MRKITLITFTTLEGAFAYLQVARSLVLRAAYPKRPPVTKWMLQVPLNWTNQVRVTLAQAA